MKVFDDDDDDDANNNNDVYFIQIMELGTLMGTVIFL